MGFTQTQVYPALYTPHYQLKNNYMSKLSIEVEPITGISDEELVALKKTAEEVYGK